VGFGLNPKAEALHLADRTSEALEAIREAEALAEEREERYWSAELHRLRGVFLAAMGADQTQIEASFCEAIRVATQQKSVSVQKRAEATYAEYGRQKVGDLEGVDADYLFVNRLQRPGCPSRISTAGSFELSFSALFLRFIVRQLLRWRLANRAVFSDLEGRRFAAVSCAAPLPKLVINTETAQDASGKNFVPKSDLTR
jgi:hypothetical protein